MPVTLEQNQARTRILLEGSIHIGEAADLKALLQQALAAGKDIRIDLERVTGLDLSALQLLWACASSARVAGLGFAAVGLVDGRIPASLADAGLESLLDFGAAREVCAA